MFIRWTTGAFGAQPGKAMPSGLAGWAILMGGLYSPRRMVVVKIKKREAIPEADNRLAKAMSRTTARRKLMEADGGSLSAKEAAGELGISQAAILKMYHSGQIIAWNDGRPERGAFSRVANQRPRIATAWKRLSKSCSASCLLHDFGRMLFFLSNQGFLEGKRPLDCLRAGEVTRC